MLTTTQIELAEQQSLEKDLAKYRELSLFLSTHNIDDVGFMESWQQLEQIKNRYKGNPPTP